MKRALLVLACSLRHRDRREARHDRTVSGDIIKAARFLQSARLDDAKAMLADLEKRAPDTVEVKWLAGRARVPDRRLRAGAERCSTRSPTTRSTAWSARPASSRRRRSRSPRRSSRRTSPKGHFIIRYAPGPDAAIADLAGEVLDTAWETIGDDLGLEARRIRSASRSSARRPTSRRCRR